MFMSMLIFIFIDIVNIFDFIDNSNISMLAIIMMLDVLSIIDF